MSGCWRVQATLESGEVFDEIIVSESSTDATVILGNHIRANRPVDEHGQAGIIETRAVAVADSRAGEALNRPH